MVLPLVSAAAIHLAAFAVAIPSSTRPLTSDGATDPWLEVTLSSAQQLRAAKPLETEPSSASDSAASMPPQSKNSSAPIPPTVTPSMSTSETNDSWPNAEGYGLFNDDDFATIRSAAVNRGAQRSRATTALPTFNQSSKPQLLATSVGCADLFPYGAQTAHGEVAITVQVDSSGHARLHRIVQEIPHGEGFALAARNCSERLRFAPAVDGSGEPIHSQAQLKLTFDRPS